MTIPARLRAGIVVTLVWATFFGLVGMLFRAAMMLLRHRLPADPLLLMRPLLGAFLDAALFGLVLGAAFALALSRAKRPAAEGRLSAGVAALLGGGTGAIVGATVLALLMDGVTLGVLLYAAATLGLVSAGVGAALVGSSQPRALRAGAE